MAPRGIVALAISSIFALRLAEAGNTQAQCLAPLTLMVIVSTVVIYGLTASPLAHWLKVAYPNHQGTLIIGAHSWARNIASALKEEGYQVLLVDNNWANISAARMAGLPTYYGNILSEHALNKIELDGIGRLLALTSNDEVNSLATLRFGEIFGSSEIYQLPTESEKKSPKETVARHLRGRFLFSPDVTYWHLTSRFAAGAVIKKVKLTEEFDYEVFQGEYGKSALPLFLIDETGDLIVLTIDNPPTPKPGQLLISLVDKFRILDNDHGTTTSSSKL